MGQLLHVLKEMAGGRLADFSAGEVAVRCALRNMTPAT